MTKVGIDKIGIFIPKYYVEMTELAHARNIDPDKLTIGIGQDKMAIPTIQEDIVTMAANAALRILNDEDRQLIDQIIFATESSFDFSKSAATYLHELLNIQPYAKSYELKQACYGATAGLQIAADYIRLRPERKVLVIASDIAKYGLNTPGEPTQGAGAIALLVSANPRIMALDLESVSYTTNQHDFWRPSYSSVAHVDGKFSTELYQACFVQVMSKIPVTQLATLKSLVFHLPFSKMGQKALNAYRDVAPREVTPVLEQWERLYQISTKLSREVGNIYTGALYLALVSLLWQLNDLEVGERIGLFSYGSGAVAELLFGTLQPSFRQEIDALNLQELLDRRVALSVPEYEEIFEAILPVSDDVVSIDSRYLIDGVRLDRVDAHRRYYQ